MPRRPQGTDDQRAELGREPLRLATLAAHTWGLAGPSERDVTERLRKRIEREMRLQLARSKGGQSSWSKREHGVARSRRSCAPGARRSG